MSPQTIHPHEAARRLEHLAKALGPNHRSERPTPLAAARVALRRVVQQLRQVTPYAQPPASGAVDASRQVEEASKTATESGSTEAPAMEMQQLSEMADLSSRLLNGAGVCLSIGAIDSAHRLLRACDALRTAFACLLRARMLELELPHELEGPEQWNEALWPLSPWAESPTAEALAADLRWPDFPTAGAEPSRSLRHVPI